MGLDRLEALFLKFGASIRGRMAPGNWRTHFPIRFSLHGQEAVLALAAFPGEDSEGFATQVTVDLGARSPGVLKIYPEGFFTPIAKMFGAQDLSIGDRRFDALYVVKARPESLAPRLFEESRRDRLVEAVRQVGRYQSPIVDLSRGRLLVHVGQPPSSEVLLERLVRTADVLTAALLEVEISDGIRWQPPTRKRAGRCPVCASALEGDLVHCERCRTPHHRECWEYARGCTTYACGGGRAP